MFFLSMNASIVRAILLEDLIFEGKVESTLCGRKIGYYHGSFDPLHRGHEDIVENVLEHNLCDYVLIYPAWGGDSYKEKRSPITPRVDMLFAVYEKHPRVIVSKLAPGDLQNALMKDSTICGKVESKLPMTTYVGIIGSDVALEIVEPENTKKLSHFLKGERIPKKYREHTIGGVMGIPVESFIIALRDGDSIEALRGFIEERPIIATIFTRYPDVSSTKIKELFKKKESIDSLVSASVKTIIDERRLYQ
jgi:nicotinic acid mononucleotide adenylyltransferase